MSKGNLRESVCLQFCPYYKPSKSEELACKGFLVIEGLIRQGKEIPFIKSDKILDADTEKILRKHLCITCPFYEDDCDFAQHEDGASPCGGFSWIGILIEASVITIGNISTMS